MTSEIDPRNVYWFVKWRKKSPPPEAFRRWKGPEDPTPLYFSVILGSAIQAEKFKEMLEGRPENFDIKVTIRVPMEGPGTPSHR